MCLSNHTVRLPKPDLFSFDECLHFLDRGYDDCLYTLENRSVLKPLHFGGDPFLIRVREETGSLVMDVMYGNPSEKQLQNAADYVSDWFDLSRDISPFYRLLKREPRLAFMQEQYRGLRLMGIPDLFEALCWCVIGQQINLTFAHRLKQRLVETYGTSFTHRSSRHYLFPEPAQIAALTIGELRKLQFSHRKAEYLTGIAGEFAEGRISRKALKRLPDTSGMLRQLTAIRGVGEWTANYVLMKTLHRMDCITFGDTGLQNAVSTILKLGRKPARKEIETFFKLFAGWESYLVIYLWRTLSSS